MTSLPNSIPPLAVDVAVVGGGLTGLAAALLAGQHGRAVALLTPARGGDERTSALLAGSVDLLTRIGVWPLAKPLAAPLRRIRIVDATGRLLRGPELTFDASELGLDAFGHNIANAALGTVMDNVVAGRPIERVAAFADTVVLGNDAVEVSAGGRRIRAKLVVAADGRRSMARQSAGIGVEEWRYDQDAFVTSVAHHRSHDDVSTEFHTREGPFTLVPLPGKRSSLVWVGSPGRIAAVSQLTDIALAEEIERQSSAVLGHVRVDGPRQVFQLRGMRADRMAAERVALVGEAGHVLPPIGAQGLNLGLADVAELATLFAGGGDPGDPQAIAAYDRRRRADSLVRGGLVDSLNRSLISSFPLAQALRGAGLFLLGRPGPLRRAAMRYGMAGGAIVAAGKRSGGMTRWVTR